MIKSLLLLATLAEPTDNPPPPPILHEPPMIYCAVLELRVVPGNATPEVIETLRLEYQNWEQYVKDHCK